MVRYRPNATAYIHTVVCTLDLVNEKTQFPYMPSVAGLHKRLLLTNSAYTLLTYPVSCAGWCAGSQSVWRAALAASVQLVGGCNHANKCSQPSPGQHHHSWQAPSLLPTARFSVKNAPSVPQFPHAETHQV